MTVMTLNKSYSKSTAGRTGMIVFAVLAMLVCFETPVFAARQKLAVRLDLVSTPTVNAGDKVLIEWRVENVSSETLRLPVHLFGPAAADGTGMFFIIVDESRNQVQSSCPVKPPQFPDAYIPFLPGQSMEVKTFDITACHRFPEGRDYTVTLRLASQSGVPGVWNGEALSSSIRVKIKESEKKIKEVQTDIQADVLLEQWLLNYDYSTAPLFRKKIISMGVPAAPAIIRYLKKERRLLPANDLIEMLGYLPCRDSLLALAEFLETAPSLTFMSTMPDDFSSSSILSDAAVRSLEKVSSVRFKRETGDLTAQWRKWVDANAGSFPPAVKEQKLK